MKRQIAIAFATLFVAFTLCATLNAQTAEPGIRQATIPFTFHVENQAFPAGAYEIRWVGPRLLIKELNGSHQAMVIVTRMDAGSSAKRNYLRFNTYGGQYFLSEVWVYGQPFGQELQKSKLEVELASRHEPSSYAMVGLNGNK